MKKNLTVAFLISTLFLVLSVNAQVHKFPSAVGVLGQADFTTNLPGTSDHQLKQPHGIVIDPTTGKLFVADRANNRVLRWSSANSLINGSAAEAVFGQSDFNSSSAPSPTPNSLNNPLGLTIDNLGRLWVCDFSNNRVLRFDDAANISTPLAGVAASANAVYGQADFYSKAANTSGTNNASGTNMYGPCIAQYYNNTLYVADWGYNRVLRFDNIDSKVSIGGAAADVVLGQATLSARSANQGGGTPAQYTMNQPNGLHVDANGTLWVSDNGNRRILRFDNPGVKTTGGNADAELGQPAITAFITNTDAITVSSVSNAMRCVITDKYGRLYGVQDGNNNSPTAPNGTKGNRIVWYDDAVHKANGADADGIIGQPDFTTTPSQYGYAANQFSNPKYMAINNVTDEIWVTDQFNNRVLRFNMSDVLPVELTSFSASFSSNKVILKWNTATEVNNFGFDIERALAGKSPVWQKIGFVKGQGNSNSSMDYSYTDNSVSFGKYIYRLRQIDNDGTSKYSNTSEVSAGSIPKDSYFAQNYPNPFNPTTTIRFGFFENTHASLTVFDQLGRQIAALFNDQAEGGRIYEVQFNASDLSSGVYYYRIETPMHSETHKILLLK